MKLKGIFYFILLGLLFSCEEDKINLEETINNEGATTKSEYSPALETQYAVKGAMRIKLKREIGDNISIATKDGFVQSNITPLNTMLGNIKATSMRRLFPYAGKFEKRTRKEGLHLWYVVNFDEKVLVSNALAQAKQVKGIAIAEEQFKIEVPQQQIREASGAAPTVDNAPMDDPKLGRQWHYNNTGEKSKFEKGADINLFQAWKEEVGKRTVIVDIVDGGVDFNHEDLKDNMYINEEELNGEEFKDDDGNGYIDDIYGFNFVMNNGKIIPQPHGTHVAGTVAARNNNGIGVCGIAGGDGTTESGIRLMSSQMFQGNNGGDAEAAIKYGADNGAVISQNSWGYPFASGVFTIPYSLKAAIDYFVKYAGCDNEGNQLADSPMKGGVIIIAAGNDDKEFTGIPASYEPAVAVSSMAPNFKKAYYSTYGTWVDIMAPGGDQYFNGGEVYSTLPNNKYGWMQGTSMACPHVSGIAALIASKFGGPGFTNEDLKKHLLSGLRPFNIDKKNPKYAGKLGIGYIDAYAVLAEEKDNKAPEKPEFKGVDEDFTKLNVKWTAVADENDKTPIAYNLFYSKEVLNSSNYKDATMIKVNGYGYEVGTELSYLLKKLELNTKYYFAIEAVDRWGAVSDASFTEGKTKENHAPVITRTDDTPIRITGKETAKLKLKVSDPDEGQKWTFSIEGYKRGVGYTKEKDGILLRFRVSGPLGKYSLKVKVKDNFRATAEIEIPFEYYEDKPPVVTQKFDKVFTPIKKATEIDLSKHFKDPEGKELTYTVKVLNGSASSEVKDNMLVITPSKYGEGQVKITATDEGGQEISTKLDFQVVNDAIVYLVYPVPVTKILNVQLSDKVNKANLKVLTPTGKVVLEKSVKNMGSNRKVILNLSKVSGGTYVLQAEANGETFKQSFVKY